MSRIGRLPITVPAGVTVTVDDANLVTVKGPKGTLSQQVNNAITVKQEGNILTLERPTDSKPHKAMHGLYRALIHNMVVGVTDGFSKTLELVGSFVKIDAVYLTAMLKILGVTYLAEFAATICKDAGYQTIAGQIEVFARLSILAIGMPILKALLLAIRELGQ